MKPLMTLAALLQRIDDNASFLSESDLRELALLDRLRLVLVRFHEGRFLAPAQDAAGFIAACERGGFCVRDVSLPASDPHYTGKGSTDSMAGRV